ncbi:MAG: hypothetical protein WDO73_05145 [Ignavibacteriota bacterium]
MMRASRDACTESERNELQPGESSFRQGLRRGLLSYWMKHPEAKDTAEGIRLWWFAERVSTPSGVLLEELEALVGMGWVVERDLAEGSRVFALNRGAMESISSYLRDDPADPTRECADLAEGNDRD